VFTRVKVFTCVLYLGQLDGHVFTCVIPELIGKFGIRSCENVEEIFPVSYDTGLISTSFNSATGMS